MKGPSAMEFTGERYIPEKGWASIAYEHLSRYMFAANFVQGKKVLDLGSGEGYGAHFLSKVASSVVGMDLDEEAVRHACRKYGPTTGNLTYKRGSAAEIPFEGKQFEVVVCFEMLEHIAEHQEMMSEIGRVLSDDGLLIISTPNKLAYSDLPEYRNEYHIRELYLDEFRSLLGGHFPHVAYYSQKNLTGNLIAGLNESDIQPLVIRRIHRVNEKNEFGPVPHATSDHMYYIAVGCKSANRIKDFPGQLVADRDERLAREPGEQGHQLLLDREKEHAKVLEQIELQRHISLESQQQANALAYELFLEVESRRRTEQKEVEPEQHVYDLIIPIFNSRQVVSVCLDSLIRNTDHRHRIIIVDDASTDPEVEPLFRGYAERWPHIRYIRLETNMGFPGAVNTGIASSTGDVVIVNSDTEFPPQWLARMDRCRRSDPRIHIVSPLSNNATICSVPQLNKKNILKTGISVDDMARLVAETSLRRYPRVPTAVGYCMLATREVIDHVGVLDMSFGRGYGEEVDWCQRAWAAGFQSAICDDAYVFHHGEVSYSKLPEQRRLQMKNEETVGLRWPQYHQSVKIYCLLNPLRLQQQRLFESLRSGRDENKPRVLQVVHSFEEPAGTELHTRHLVDANTYRISSTVLYPRDLDPWYDAITEEEERGVLKIMMNQKLMPVERVVRGATESLRSRMVERFFSEVVLGSDAQVVHFQHLQNFGSFQLPQIAKSLLRKVIMTLHDYFLLCPDWNMIGRNGQYCGCARAQNDPTCIGCLESKHKTLRPEMKYDFGAYIDERNRHVRAALNACDVLVAPSAFVKTQFEHAHGREIARKIRVIPHGTTPYPFEPTHKPNKRLRVAFVGNMIQAKGRDVFIEVARRLQRHRIKFLVFGGTLPDMDTRALKHVEFRGRYERSSLPQMLQDVDVVVIPPVWHETYCYTVDEAFRAGVPVIASRAGAIQERIQDGETGILVEMNDPDSLERAILAVDSSRELLTKFRGNIAKLRLKSDEVNMAEYAVLYESLSGEKLDKGDLIADRMSTNRNLRMPPQVTMEEYCSRYNLPNPLLTL